MQEGRVISIEYIDDYQGEYVYNLEVEDNHNYFVSDVLVKNCDDPADPKKASSEVERENCISFFDNTASSRLNDPDVGMFIIVMQRLHEEDLTGYLIGDTPDDFEHICIPAEYDEEIVSPPELRGKYIDGLYFRSRFTTNVLNAFKKRLKDQYVGQFGQRPGKKEGNIIKTTWLDIVEPETISRDPRLEPIHFVVDPAYTEKAQNDPTGFLSFFKRHDREEIVITHAGEVWKEFPDLIAFLKEYIPTQGYCDQSIVYMEPKASGLSIIQQLRQTTKFNVCPIESDLLKVDKVTRVNSVTPQLQGMKVKLLRGAWNKSFAAQAGAFPKGKHDDMLDCLCYAIDLYLSQDEFQYWII